MSEQTYEAALEEMNSFLSRIQGRTGRPSFNELAEFSELEQGVYDALRAEKEANEQAARVNRRYGNPYMSKWIFR